MLVYLADYLSQYYSGFNVFQYLTLRAILGVLTALLLSFVIGPEMIRRLEQEGLVVVEDGAATRQRHWRIAARRVVLATGALERPFVFPGNDRPGVMLAGAALAYARRFGVAVGRDVAGTRRQILVDRLRGLFGHQVDSAALAGEHHDEPDLVGTVLAVERRAAYAFGNDPCAALFHDERVKLVEPAGPFDCGIE